MIQFIIVILFLIIAIYGFFRWFERFNVWQPGRQIVADPSSIGLYYEDVLFKSKDGVQLHGWYIPAENSRACVLFCHGNAGNISHRLETIRHMELLNLDFFLFDYRGFGRSSGLLTEKGTLADAHAAYEWLKNKVPDKPLVIFGRSLGASIATHLAAKVEAKGFVCESTFKSITSLGKRLFPYLPVTWLTTIKYNTHKAMKKINMPVLIIHSTEDDLIPYEHGKALFEAANEPKRLLTIRGSHMDGYLMSEEDYLKAWQSFLDEFIYEERAPVKKEELTQAN